MERVVYGRIHVVPIYPPAVHESWWRNLRYGLRSLNSVENVSYLFELIKLCFAFWMSISKVFEA
jgi:hypothetical protein